MREIGKRPKRIERIGDGPRPDQRHDCDGENEIGQHREHELPEPAARRTQAVGASLHRNDKRERGKSRENSKAAHDARADREAEAQASERAGREAGSRILLEGAHQTKQQERHRCRERGVLGVHETVADIKRAGREQDERQKSSKRPTEAAAGAPSRDQSDEADRRAKKAARLEQRERQNLGG